MSTRDATTAGGPSAAAACPKAACPKQMVHGPCGGVAHDGACELGDRRCAFLGTPTVRWAGGGARRPPAPEAAQRMRARLAEGPVLVADLSVRAMSAPAIAAAAAALAGHVDAVLVGDGPNDRVQFPPAHRAALLRAAGLEVWSGLNCRDRNRVALEGELAALADIGVAGVHCVTGDLPQRGHRPDAAGVFDLDSTALAALAAAAGHLVSVAESPAAPPTTRRAARLVEKLRAGAEVCFVNHCGSARQMARFVAEVRDLGGTPRFVACVPVVVDAASAAMLATFPGLVLPPGYLEGVVDAADPRRAGIEAAARFAGQLLEAGLDGLDLSGGAGQGDHAAYANAIAELAERIGAR